MSQKIALIIGGSGYIGSEVVAALSAADRQVIFTYHNNKTQADKLQQQYACSAYQLDISNPPAIRDLFAALQRDRLLPQTVVNCAAVSQQKSFLDIDDQDWESILRSNCQSVFTLCQALYRITTDYPGSVDNIILLSAINQIQSFDLPLHFAVSQAAINQFVSSSSKLFGANGCRINSVIPGMLEQGLSSGFSQQLRQDFVKFSALGRLGTASEVARCIYWLATENSYINGQCIPVNGGI